MTNLAFYAAVAAILGTTHEDFTPTGLWKKRWGPRQPGNGRYPGYGLVRVYAPDYIYVSLYDPELRGIFKSMDEALGAIREAVELATAGGRKAGGPAG